ncbi:unnamed protein product, partial [Didymodactylos carnosus]
MGFLDGVDLKTNVTEILLHLEYEEYNSIYMTIFYHQNVAMSDVLTRTNANNDEQIFDLSDPTSSSLIYSGLKLHPKPLIPTISMPGIATDAHIDTNKLSSTNCNSLTNLRQQTVHLTSNNNINSTSSSTSTTPQNSSSIRLVSQQKPLSSTSTTTNSQSVQLQIFNKPISNIVAMAPIIQTTPQQQQHSNFNQSNKVINGTNSSNAPSPSSYSQFSKAFILNQPQSTMMAQTSSYMPKVHQQTLQSTPNSSSPPQTTMAIKHSNIITPLNNSILIPQQSSPSLLTLVTPSSFSSVSSSSTNTTVSTLNSLSNQVTTVTPKIQTLNSTFVNDSNGQTQQSIYLQSTHNAQFSDLNSKSPSNALQITVRTATPQLQNTAAAVMNNDNHHQQQQQQQQQSQQVFSLATKNKLTVVQPYIPTVTTTFTTSNPKNIITQSSTTTPKLVIQQGSTIWPQHAQNNLLNCTTVPKIYSIPHPSVVQAKVLSRPVQLFQADHTNKTSDVCFLQSARTGDIKNEKNDNGMSTSFQIAGVQLGGSPTGNNFTPLNVQVPHFSKAQ